MLFVASESAPPAAAPKPNWARHANGFFGTPVGGAVLTLICTTLLGAMIGNYFTAQQRQEAERLEEAKQSESARHNLIELFARSVVARRTAVGLLRSGIELDAPQTELRSRWNAYQDSYVNYNVKYFAFLNGLLTYLGRRDYQTFDHSIDQSITRSFERIDYCLTLSYRAYQRRGRRAAKHVLTTCQTVKRVPFDLAAQIDQLDTCFGTVRHELVEAIFLEDRLDHLAEDKRRDNPWYVQWLWPRRVGMQLCPSASDLPCFRQIFGEALPKKLAIPACTNLQDAMYLPPTQSSIPLPRNSKAAVTRP